MTPTRVAMWSGPRNISTALMRAWENRPDTVVVDEPFYASYLARTGKDHPGRHAVLASQPQAVDAVLAALGAPLPSGRSVQYVKHMAHHLDPADDLAWARQAHNVLLVRDPAEVVASYVRSREACEPEDIGLLQQERLLDTLARDGGGTPPVIDAADFLRDPERHLRWLCDRLGIGFTAAMLSWPTGPRSSDGVWAPYWYDAVWRSTGFEPWRPREVRLSDHDAAVAEVCRPAYERLHALRVRLT
ncbi:MAG: HAD family hydrolase [Nocardioidaceae bacterium]